MYPGTLLESIYDPRGKSWYLGALASPGKVVVSPPYLDPGGAGFIVTMSHTVYEGEPAAMHTVHDPVVAVLAADFTVGYWYKLLTDLEPLCNNENDLLFGNENKKNNNSSNDTESELRCFLMNEEGYLVIHPSMMNPHSSQTYHHHHLPRHITHQEPIISMSLLGLGLTSDSTSSRLDKISKRMDIIKSRYLKDQPIDSKDELGENLNNNNNDDGVLHKKTCGRWWHGASERHYSIKVPVGKIVSSDKYSMIGQGEHSCISYSLTAIPGTNLIFGIINQTCAPVTAFCPCSQVS